MKNWNQFSSENLLMSVGGHLVMVAILLTSFALVVDRAQLVAPDRVEIVEIDLNAVRVRGDETILYNTDAQKSDIPDKKPEPEPAPAAAIDDTPQPIETPSMVADAATPDKKPAAADENDKTPDTPAPQKKTVVRVKRDVVSLDRTLTVSVVDALRVAMTRCWVIDTRRPDIADIRAVAHLTMRRNGTVRDVWFESAAREQTDPAFAYVLQTIRAAINTCQPLKMLPPGEFEKWEKIELTFYPTQGKVM